MGRSRRVRNYIPKVINNFRATLGNIRTPAWYSHHAMSTRKTTQKQRDASRDNGKKSHGPVTPEGKARFSRNATLHGFYSGSVVLMSEDESEFDRLLEAYTDHWQPATPIEASLVQVMVKAFWRFSRVGPYEACIINSQVILGREQVDELLKGLDNTERAALAFQSIADNSRVLGMLVRVEGRQLRTMRDAMADLSRIQAERLRSAPPAVEAGIEKRRFEPDVLQVECPHVVTLPTPPAETPDEPLPDLPEAA
jgi:hypothetical protein